MLGSVKGRCIQFITGVACIAGFALLLFAGVLVVAIPIGLALLFLAFAEARRGVESACALAIGQESLCRRRRSRGPHPADGTGRP